MIWARRRRTRRHRALSAVNLSATVLLLVMATACGATATSARSSLSSAFAATKAAGSADFRIVTTAPLRPGGPEATTVTVGAVNFRQQVLTLVHYIPGLSASTPGHVIEIGTTEYDQVPALLGCWDSSREPRPLSALLFALSPPAGSERVTKSATARSGGLALSEYQIHVPAVKVGGAISRAHTLDVWVDSSKRVRSEAQVLTETGIVGFPGPLTVSTSIGFTNFGTPVHVRAPSACAARRGSH